MLHKYKYNGFIEFLLFLNNNNTKKIIELKKNPNNMR